MVLQPFGLNIRDSVLPSIPPFALNTPITIPDTGIRNMNVNMYQVPGALPNNALSTLPGIFPLPSQQIDEQLKSQALAQLSQQQPAHYLLPQFPQPSQPIQPIQPIQLEQPEQLQQPPQPEQLQQPSQPSPQLVQPLATEGKKSLLDILSGQKEKLKEFAGSPMFNSLMNVARLLTVYDQPHSPVYQQVASDIMSNLVRSDAQGDASNMMDFFISQGFSPQEASAMMMNKDIMNKMMTEKFKHMDELRKFGADITKITDDGSVTANTKQYGIIASAVPGSPADMKKNQEFNSRMSGADYLIFQSKTAIDIANSLMQDLKNSNIPLTGVTSRALSLFAGHLPADFTARLASLRAMVGMENIRKLREAVQGSPLGQVTQGEHKLLQDLFGPLGTDLSLHTLTNSLQNVQKWFQSTVDKANKYVDQWNNEQQRWHAIQRNLFPKYYNNFNQQAAAAQTPTPFAEQMISPQSQAQEPMQQSLPAQPSFQINDKGYPMLNDQDAQLRDDIDIYYSLDQNKYMKKAK